MPLKKRKDKNSSRPTSANRRISSSERGKPVATGNHSDIRIDFSRQKDYAWIAEQIKRQYQHKKKTAMPQDIKPMLASTLDAPFDDTDWQFEIKWDGYRALAYISNGKVNLRSRNNKSFNKDYAEVRQALEQWPVQAVVDGEIVVLSEKGHADFEALQSWKKEHKGELRYYVFDLLWINGIDLQKEPLTARREVLQKIVPENSIIRFSDSIEEYGTSFFEAARENGLEGIIAKQKNSIYRPSTRTADWYKIKAEKRHEVIICGYTRNDGMDRLFSSLIVATLKENKLIYIGQVGTGFTQSKQAELLHKMRPITTNTCPFEEKPAIQGFVQWVRPLLVGEVKYTELTSSGVMRHPSFLGLRPDKTILDWNTEDSKPGNESEAPEALQEGDFLPSGKEATTKVIDGHELRLTNLNKLFWPKEKITKGDLIDYYHQVAPVLLPYMKNRPQSLNRFPDGVTGKSFYQKNMAGKVEGWLKTFQRFSDSDGEPKDFLVCTNEASLLYIANLGCIEMNPWHSRIQSPAYPDWCVIDLDPGDISFKKVIVTARVVHELLSSLGLPSYPKTSGATGLHIYIPLGARYKYEQSRQLAELIAHLTHQQLSSFTSLVRDPSQRKDKIYIDYLQNRPIQTICAPYSVRPRPGATVSTPLDWSEVNESLKIKKFTMKTLPQRLKSEGDLFAGVLGTGIDLNDTLKKLAGIISG